MRLLVLQRLGLFAIMALAMSLLPNAAGARNLSALPDFPTLDPWLRSDSFDFLLEASRRGTTQVFPLYPELVRALGWVVSVPIAALLVANLALVMAVFALDKLVSPADAGLARLSVLALAFFPSSFLLSAGNELSLFLACAIGTFAAHTHGRQKLAAACAVAGVLSHPLGALTLSLPLLLEWWVRRGRNAGNAVFPQFVLAIPLGLLLLAALSRINTGDAFRLPSQALLLTRLAGESTVARLGAHLPPIELTTGYGVWLDWAAIALSLGAAAHCFKLGEHAFAGYCVLALFGHLLLYGSPARWFETVILAFPVYVAIGRWCSHAPAGRAYAVAAPMLQATFAVLFGAGLWAA